jgi:hypothetical protein
MLELAPVSKSSRATGKVGTHHPIAQEFWKSLCRRTPGFDVSRPMPVFGIGDRLYHCFEWHVFMCAKDAACCQTLAVTCLVMHTAFDTFRALIAFDSSDSTGRVANGGCVSVGGCISDGR